MGNQKAFTIGIDMFGLIVYLNGTKRESIGYHRSQKLIVVTSNIDYSGTSLCMTKDSTNYIRMRLLPPPFVLSNLPSINDITNKVESITGIMFKKIIQFISLTISGT
jgi:hypothetical protein